MWGLEGGVGDVPAATEGDAVQQPTALGSFHARRDREVAEGRIKPVDGGGGGGERAVVGRHSAPGRTAYDRAASVDSIRQSHVDVSFSHLTNLEFRLH